MALNPVHRILDRYLVSQIIDTLLIALSVFTLLVFFSDTFLDFIRDVQKYGIPLDSALLLIGLQLPKTIALIVPASAFLAVLMVYSALNGKHEIMAMRMSGIPLFRLARPAIVVGILATLFTYAMGDYVVPLCTKMVDDIKEELLAHGTLPVGRQSVTFKDEDSNGQLRKMIYVSGYDGDNLGPSTIIDVSDPKVMQIVQSRGGQWTPTHWAFHNANVYSIFKEKSTFTFNHSRIFRVKDLLNSNGIKATSSDRQQRKKLEEALSVDASQLNFATLAYRIGEREQRGMIVNKGTYVRMWEKLTMPLSCLAMILVAIPLAITAPRQSGNRGIVFAIGALFLFYILRAVFVAVGRSGVIPDSFIPLQLTLAVASWLPVLLIGALGAYLLWRKRLIL